MSLEEVFQICKKVPEVLEDVSVVLKEVYWVLEQV